MAELGAWGNVAMTPRHALVCASTTPQSGRPIPLIRSRTVADSWGAAWRSEVLSKHAILGGWNQRGADSKPELAVASQS